jgi:glycosyltransferase involved in cell wall biosynthesis
MATPLISVIMPVYNGADYLSEAVDSILAQTLGDFEFIVIDDASTDETPRILAEYADPRLHIVTNPANLGLTRNLNSCIAMARGDLIARHDADDRSHPERFARQIAFLERNPDIAILGTQCRAVDSAGRPKRDRLKRPLWPGAVRWQSIIDNPFIHSTMMMRADVVKAEGGYDERFRTSQDAELWSRILRRHGGANLADVLLDFRIHEKSVSRAYNRAQIAMVHDLIRNNLVHELGTADETWLADWVWINNPSLWQTDRCTDPRGLVEGLIRLKDPFTASLQDKVAAEEIEIQCRATIARIMRNLALSGAPGLWQAGTAFIREAPAYALAQMPGVALRATLARVRRNK